MIDEMGENSTKKQWSRVRAGQSAIVPIAGPQTHSGGLVIKGLEEQIRENKERQEALFMETNLVADTGLNVDEVFFLDSLAEVQFELQQNKKKEIEAYKQEVAESVHVNEVSYFDTLREAKKKQKVQKTKKRSLVPTSTLGAKKQKTRAQSEASNPPKETKETKEQPTEKESNQELESLLS